MYNGTIFQFQKEGVGHSKERMDYSKTESKQDKHQILQLHVLHLKLVMSLSGLQRA